MGIFGKTFKINRFESPTYYPLGGTILNATLDPRIETHMEAGTGQRQLASHKVVAAKPVLDFEMNIRRLTDYITVYAMISAEGVVPAHTLYYTDGTEHHKFENAKVNTCRISISTMESIKAKIQVALKSDDTFSPSTFEARTEKAMYKDAVTKLEIGTTVTGWREIEFGVDNKVLQEVLGTTIPPSEVEEQEAVYSGHVLLAKPSTSKYAAALVGTPQTVKIDLIDNQSPTPVTKTFTFADAQLKTSKHEVKPLGLIFERIEWEGKSLVIG